MYTCSNLLTQVSLNSFFFFWWVISSECDYFNFHALTRLMTQGKSVLIAFVDWKKTEGVIEARGGGSEWGVCFASFIVVSLDIIGKARKRIFCQQSQDDCHHIKVILMPFQLTVMMGLLQQSFLKYQKTWMTMLKQERWTRVCLKDTNKFLFV